MNRNHKEALEPFAEIYAGASRMLLSLTDDELILFVEACANATTTNCWCYSYTAARALGQEARYMLHARGLSRTTEAKP